MEHVLFDSALANQSYHMHVPIYIYAGDEKIAINVVSIERL